MHTKNTRKNLYNLDLLFMTLIFDRLLEVVKAHVRAKFLQTKCSGSHIIVLTEKKLSDDAENNTAVASAGID